MEKKFLITITTVLFFSSLSLALDTTEPFERGFSDNELYLGFNGIGLNKGQKSLGLEYVLGAGVSDRLSSTLVLSLGTNEYFNYSYLGAGVGLFLNAIDLELFKLDFMTSLSSDGIFTFGTEINLDFKAIGFQLTLEEALENDGEFKVLPSTALVPQANFNLGESVQLLTAVDLTFSRDGAEIGAAAIGANIVLNDIVELINEISFDIPQDSEKFSAGLLIGFVATIP